MHAVHGDEAVRGRRDGAGVTTTLHYIMYYAITIMYYVMHAVHGDEAVCGRRDGAVHGDRAVVITITYYVMHAVHGDEAVRGR
eukprot:352905-Prorocentrum_minimum.AAC.1